jgi:hypothetical protein
VIRVSRDPRTQVHEPDEADGDVPTLRAIECRHGHLGYCADDAVPGEREAIDALYQHAFEYGVRQGDRDRAERYAAWLLAASWRPGALFMRGSHAVDFPEFVAADA